MRTATFLGICGLIAYGLLFPLEALMAYLGISMPRAGVIIYKVIEVAILGPVVAIILNPVNQKIRLWRKKRGRDIEAEERHETESGFIKLTPFD
jgi:hypothetical protein